VPALRQPRGVGIALRDPLPWPVFAGAARLAEEVGYAALLLPEIAGRDALAALAALASETTRVALGTGVVPMRSRSLRLTAMAAATVHERSGGRAVLGLGTGGSGRGALDELERRAVDLRRAFAGDVVDDEGDRWRLSLELPGPVPIWLSALGPRAVDLAGRVADGALLNWCTPERVVEAAAAIRRAAEGAGRDPEEVTVAVYLRAASGDDGHAAFRRMAADYAGYAAYARQFAAMGLGDAASAAAAGDDAAADRIVAAVGLPADPGAARDRLLAYREAGAGLPVVYPVLGDPPSPASLTETIRVLAPAAAD